MRMRKMIDADTLLDKVDELEEKVRKLCNKDATIYFEDYRSARKYAEANKLKNYMIAETNVSTGKGKKRFCVITKGSK